MCFLSLAVLLATTKEVFVLVAKTQKRSHKKIHLKHLVPSEFGFFFFARCVWCPFRSLLLLTCTVLAAVTWQLEHVATCHGTRENFVLRAIMTDLEAKYYKALVIMNDLNVSCAWCTLHSPVGKHQKSLYNCIQYTVYIVSLQPNQTDH